MITVDHGRGDKNKDQWKDHGEKVSDASEIWFAVLGPDSKHLGEVSAGDQLYQRQFASTISSFLGLEFRPSHPIAAPIKSALQ